MRLIAGFVGFAFGSVTFFCAMSTHLVMFTISVRMVGESGFFIAAFATFAVLTFFTALAALAPFLVSAAFKQHKGDLARLQILHSSIVKPHKSEIPNRPPTALQYQFLSENSNIKVFYLQLHKE